MAIPYVFKHLTPGRVKIKSPYLKHLDYDEGVLRAHIDREDGVRNVGVNKKTGTLTVEYDPRVYDLDSLFSFFKNSTPQRLVEALGSREKRRKANAEGGKTGALRWFVASTLGLVPLVLGAAIPRGMLNALTLALAYPIFKKAASSLKARRLDVHILDSSAIAISTLSGSNIASMLMVWLLSLGDLIEEKTQGTAHRAIEKLFGYEAEYAWLVVEDGQTSKVQVSAIKPGDTIVSYTGEKIGVDGVVIDGEALVNQASLTGEANPVLKKRGDKVYAGTFVEDGKLYTTAEKVGKETALAQIVRIIEESIAEPLETQKRAEEVANRFVLPTIVTSGCVYVLTGNLERMTSVLTFDYHTGIHVSTPTSIMSHMALAASQGILFKSGRHLEVLHRVDTVVFDKTGTLTVGHPEITQIIPYEITEDLAIQYAASLEQRLTHPVAKSILHMASTRGIELLPRKESKYHRGLGIEAVLNGGVFLIGSTRFMEKKKIEIPESVKKDVDLMHEKGESVLYLVEGRRIIALLGFADPLRPESKGVVEALQSLGREVILCTGDNEGAAELVARRLNIHRYFSRAFPDEKARIIKALKREGRTVAFLGDGVNDSPALSVADIGISIKSGADIAIEVADVVIQSNLEYLIKAIKFSDMALGNIEKNYKINTIANTIGMVGAIAGILSPVVATVINNGTTVLIGINALRPLWNRKSS